MKTTAEKIAVMQAYVDGKQIEIASDEVGSGRWYAWPVFCSSPEWNWEQNDYRIYEEPKEKPSINWEHVRDRYNYLSRDENGEWYFWEKRPLMDGELAGYWYKESDDGSCMWRASDIHLFASFKPGNCDWKDSLISRSGKE